MNEAIAHSRTRPDHVPDELYWDRSLMEFARELADPYKAMSRLHEGPDIIYAREISRKPGWLITRAADMAEAFVDYDSFSCYSDDSEAQPFNVGGGARLVPNSYDPPEHRVYRRVLDPLFTPSAVKKYENDIRQLCRELMTPFEGAGGCDFVWDFARYFPTTFFLRLMGMPHDKFEQFMAWEEAFTRGTNTERNEAIRHIIAYLEGYIEYRRKEPGDDLVSLFLNSQFDGRPPRHDEVLGFCTQTYIGGLDTVLSALSWQFHHVATTPELQTRLRDNPQDIPKAVHEMLRAFPVAALPRVVAKDMVFKGVAMKQGDSVYLPTYLAGRDPQLVDRPHEVDIDRPLTRHLSFGTGNHLCLGRNLAMLELRVVFEEWLSRFNNIRLADDFKFEWSGPSVLRLDRLDLVWD